MTMQDGMFVGTTASQMESADGWLGYKLDFFDYSADRSSWLAMINSVSYGISQEKAAGGEALHWTIPLVVYGGTLAAAADYQYDGFWRQAAEKLAASIPAGQTMVIRAGEEFNGGWFAWAAAGHEDQFAQAYRNLVDTFRSVSPNFKFEWNIGVSVGGTDVAKAYPGDAYVDYIGGDMYWDSTKSWSFTDPTKAFQYYETHQYGLNWMADFANEHGKQLAFSEWAVNSDSGGPTFMSDFRTWLQEHNVAYEAYWDSDANFSGQFTNGDHKAIGTAYKEDFGHYGTAHAGADIATL